ncbi:hypothetical protein G5T42_08570 [Microbacterium sp. 4R-513]|uniref:hypothetical protein n=1 Tax=Microbacterium sp. 4R-513 TaxID=2567934 RepID=UPI0013E1045F|nr:hypothetical protein [Microbacterium sp. 4R-513]QIG39534.1 hypothetical protein G5T42_08570 [Microbacterium sp. 4R-513]
MEDVDDARELVEQRMRDTGFEEDIFDRVLELLERFDTDREKLFEEMLDKLEAPGYDGLRDRWATNCVQAEALLDRLEEDMTSILEDSEANALSAEERMEAVGPGDFLAGERKIWAEVAKLDVPDVATLMGKVLETDLAIIKKCEEDLKQALSSDAIVQRVLEKNFGGVSETAKGLVVKYTQLPTAFARLVVFFMQDRAAKDAATEAIQAWEKAAAEMYQAARDKRAAKQTVLANIKLLTDAREQLDEGWIDQLLARGSDAAESWAGIGQSGDYRAADWEELADHVIDDGLEPRAVAAKEQSARLYDELYPTFIEQSSKAFAQLTDDPAALQKFTDELRSTFDSLEDLLASETDYVADLADGDYKQTAVATLEQTKLILRTGWDALFQKTKEADEEVKKS